VTATAGEHRGRQFVRLQDLSARIESDSAPADRIVLVSPEIVSAMPWNELIVSWNAALSPDAILKVEARAIYPGHATRFYVMGVWSGDIDRHPRMSRSNQKDDDGEVLTDTLALNRPCERVQLRFTLDGVGAGDRSALKFVGLCFADTELSLSELPPNRAAWGKTLPVPEHSQLDYPSGERSWCSPACTSMVLEWWSGQLDRPDLRLPVPDVAGAVYDPNWPGTGNWPFNTAFAGSLPAVRGYVTRFSDVSEIEDWIAAGVPVPISVAYTVLKGAPPRAGPDGHLVVCVGFNEDGDVIVNDPGVPAPVRRVYPRENLIKAWARSHNTVYLIHPERTDIPPDRFGHWERPDRK